MFAIYSRVHWSWISWCAFTSHILLILIHSPQGRTLNKQWADDHIACFVQAFTLLKTSLNTGIGVQVALISHRMYEGVQSIGWCD